MLLVSSSFLTKFIWPDPYYSLFLLAHNTAPCLFKTFHIKMNLHLEWQRNFNMRQFSLNKSFKS
jgi:hypothetical protein